MFYSGTLGSKSLNERGITENVFDFFFLFHLLLWSLHVEILNTFGLLINNRSCMHFQLYMPFEASTDFRDLLYWEITKFQTTTKYTYMRPDIYSPFLGTDNSLVHRPLNQLKSQSESRTERVKGPIRIPVITPFAFPIKISYPSLSGSKLWDRSIEKRY